MDTERKKTELKPITKLEPKQRGENQTLPISNLIVEEEKPSVKRSENKYVRIALDAKGEERSEFSAKVKIGEIKYAYYATDGDKEYHYYKILKK